MSAVSPLSTPLPIVLPESRAHRDKVRCFASPSWQLPLLSQQLATDSIDTGLGVGSAKLWADRPVNSQGGASSKRTRDPPFRILRLPTTVLRRKRALLPTRHHPLPGAASPLRVPVVHFLSSKKGCGCAGAPRNLFCLSLMRGFPASPRGEGGSHSSSVPQLSVGTLLAAWRGPAPPLPTPPAGGPGGGGSAAAARRVSFIPQRTHDTEPTLKPSETRALSAFKGWGERGGPRHSAAATTARGRGCAGPLRAACRPPPNFAQRQHGTASPVGLAQRRGRSSPSGGEGLALSHPSPPLLLLLPPRSQAGQPGGTERPAPSSAAVAAAARTVTLAAFAAIYIHTIGFHS